MSFIIKQGKHKKIKCKNCESIIGYTGQDICQKNYPEILGNWGYEKYIKCPFCNKNIILTQVINGKTQKV